MHILMFMAFRYFPLIIFAESYLLTYDVWHIVCYVYITVL